MCVCVWAVNAPPADTIQTHMIFILHMPKKSNEEFLISDQNKNSITGLLLSWQTGSTLSTGSPQHPPVKLSCPNSECEQSCLPTVTEACSTGCSLHTALFSMIPNERSYSRMQLLFFLHLQLLHSTDDLGETNRWRQMWSVDWCTRWGREASRVSFNFLKMKSSQGEKRGSVWADAEGVS